MGIYNESTGVVLFCPNCHKFVDIRSKKAKTLESFPFFLENEARNLMIYMSPGIQVE